MRKYLSIIIASALVCAALMGHKACTGAQNASQYITIEGFAQGGTYTVKANTTAEAEYLKNGIDSILNVIDYAVSGYNKASLLSRYNAGAEITPDDSPEYRVFSELSSYCDSIRIATGGAVDTRAAALFDVWGFGFKNNQMPGEQQVEEAMADRSKMNFNAVAQGYSADLVAAYLDRNGVKDMLVNIGGEMLTRGHNAKGMQWRMGIDKPVDGNNTPGAQLSGTFDMPVEQYAVVTSGNYRKFYVKDGTKYSHTVDPRTGYPVQHSLLSATILAPTSALADALATYCMVIGPDQAKSFILSRSDIEGCLITDTEIWSSPGLKLN